MTEAALQYAVIGMAKVFRWAVHHDRPMQTKTGEWLDPVQGHVGFPDLVLARRGRLIIAELKSARGRLTEAQKTWLEALTGLAVGHHSDGTWANGVELDGADGPAGPNVTVHIWRPMHLRNGAIEAVLR